MIEGCVEARPMSNTALSTWIAQMPDARRTGFRHLRPGISRTSADELRYEAWRQAIVRHDDKPIDADGHACETSYSPDASAPRKCDNLRARIWCARLSREATVRLLKPSAAAISS